MNYAGDLTATDAAAMLAENADAVLIDVRTAAEWNWVGVPDMSNARFVQWVSWPDGQPNSNFVAEATQDLDPAQPLLMLCRSGARSAAAAEVLAAAGFSAVHNIVGGFEGDLDAAGRRTGGWRGAGLSWRQN